MDDFDWVFDNEEVGPATDLFTDRVAENVAFDRAVLRHLERLLDRTAVLGNPVRNNVLVYYGQGGIGKTALSRRLERWIRGELAPDEHWGPAPSFDQQVRTVRVDFHGSSVVSPIDILLSLRAAVAGVGRRFPAFDLGLAAWWAMARPGTPLPNLATGTFDVRAQITDTLNELLSEAGMRLGAGPLTVRMGTQLIEAVRLRRIQSAALRDCIPLARIIEEIRLNPSPYVAATLAGLFSWDLERLVVGEVPLLIAFADACEYVQGGSRVQERLVNRIVHLTPGVLWVVSTRDSLRWPALKPGGGLPAVGPQVWPGLRLEAEAEPRQHRVGDLSDVDVDRYLAAASGSSGNPVLSEDIRRRIREGAHGLPLYLDLSLAIARAGAAHGPLNPADFGGSLPELVTTVFADLPPSERDIARTASLIPRFDPEIVAQAAGHRLADAQRLCARPLISRDSHPVLPYRMHDAVRTAVSGETADDADGWAAEDRRACAERLLVALRARYDALTHVDHRMDVLEVAACLSATFDLRAPWLLTALTAMPGMAQTAARLPQPAIETWMGQISMFFDGWRDRTIRERISYFQSLLEQPFDPDIRELIQRFVAYGYRGIHQPEPALAVFQALLARHPESDLYRYQLARTLRELRRYRELETHLRQYPLAPPTHTRMECDILFDQGYLDESIDGVRERVAYLRSVGDERLALDNEAALRWREALAGRTSVASCEDLIRTTDRYGQPSNMRTAMGAKAVCLAGTSGFAAAIAELHSVTEATLGKTGHREVVPVVLDALRRGDADALVAERDRWVAQERHWSTNVALVNLLFEYADLGPVTFASEPIPDIDMTPHRERWLTTIGRIVAAD
ncbi:hypothetical protein ACGFI9_02315 [Micromonospora sp. NPDC048930]|uniref:hypothetical protein n=1 Tax=Micromonospora sp. NPDC048930 TaxID=3364261 RepID=UPI003717FD83